MITKDSIRKIRASMSKGWSDMRLSDLAFGILLSVVEDPQTVAAMVYGQRQVDGKELAKTKKVEALRKCLKEYGIGRQIDDKTISREENRSELIAMIDEIRSGMSSGKVKPEAGLNMIKDIRVKLNDKFEIEASGANKRIIVVPQKRDIICPHTHRECTYMPTREACMRYYNLTEKGNGDEEDKAGDSGMAAGGQGEAAQQEAVHEGR